MQNKHESAEGMDGDWDLSSPSSRLRVADKCPVRTKRKRDERYDDDEDAEGLAPKYPPFPKTPGFQYSPPPSSPSYTPQGSPVREALPMLQTKHGNTVSLSFIRELDLAELHTLLGAVTDAFAKKSGEMERELQILRRKVVTANTARRRADRDYHDMEEGPEKDMLAVHRNTLWNTVSNT